MTLHALRCVPTLTVCSVTYTSPLFFLACMCLGFFYFNFGDAVINPDGSGIISGSFLQSSYTFVCYWFKKRSALPQGQITSLPAWLISVTTFLLKIIKICSAEINTLLGVPL